MVRANLKGKSLLEERWLGNLDDSQADTVGPPVLKSLISLYKRVYKEMSLPAAGHLRLFKLKRVT